MVGNPATAESASATDATDATYIQGTRSNLGAEVDGFSTTVRRRATIEAGGLRVTFGFATELHVGFIIEPAPVELELAALYQDLFAKVDGSVGALRIEPFEVAVPLLKSANVAHFNVRPLRATADDPVLDEFVMLLQAAA